MPAPTPAIYPGSFAIPTGLPIFPDASVREEHGVQYTVSSVPIEGGPQVTDHVQRQPIPLVVDVALAQSPDAVFVVPSKNRAKGMYEDLLGLFDTRQPFEFWTSLRAYPSMICTSCSVPRSAESGDALIVTLVMQQIEIALVNQLQVLADAALALALGTQDVGSLTPSIDSAIEGAGAVG
jgi:hypothetical protein